VPFDGLILKNVIHEINTRATGGIIFKITQHEKNTIIIFIKNNNEKFNLLVSSNPSCAKLHFTKQKYENPVMPYNFCMLLRKNIKGGKISNVSQIGLDRIAKIDIENYNKIGNLVKFFLYIEIMGRCSNIILTNENEKILDSIKHVDQTISSIRQILPKFTYEFPPNNGKINPLNIRHEKTIEIFKNINDEENCKNLILKNFEGISSKSAEEIINFHLKNYSNFNNFSESFTNFFKNIENYNFSTCVLINLQDNKKNDFLYCDPKTNLFDFKKKEFDNTSDALNFFYETEQIHVEALTKYKNLIKLIQKNISRCDKKNKIFQKTLEECKNIDEYKLFGDLIILNIHKIKKGYSEITVQNYYSENLEKITIKLKENLTASENAQFYYKIYNKTKTAKKFSINQQELNKIEKYYLESVLNMMLECKCLSDIDEIYYELEEQKYIKKKSNKKNEIKSKPFEFTLSDKIKVLVGKNNKQNDYLTFKLSLPTDLWFHVKDIPGSHVIAKIDKNFDITEEDIIKIAIITSYFSKAKNLSKVPVDYTKIKNIKKMKNKRPGMVIYNNYKTIYVTPNEKFIQNLLREPCNETRRF
jgi:predicted ribosome quality control (RQC) complex YloA/Tae2 family protein